MPGNGRPGAIRIRGAREHNLKGLDLEIPLGRLTVITGVSGSGKSSLVRDILYAEGQRRYVETFSAYARQFLERTARPDVEAVERVPPAIAIDPATTVRTSRSTVGTMTEITEFAKVLYARMGVLHCEGCGEPVEEDSPGRVADRLLAAHPGRRALVAFPVPLPGGSGPAVVRELLREGYRRALTSGGAAPVAEAAVGAEELWVVQDRLRLTPEGRARLVEALEAAYRRGGERARIALAEGPTLDFQRGLVCARCRRTYERLPPAAFSFNSPLGACPTCRGFGRVLGLDEALVVPNPALSLAAGAVRPFASRRGRPYLRALLAGARRAGVRTDVPWRDLTAEERRKVFEGTPYFPGVEDLFAHLETKSYKMHVRVFLSRYRGYHPCPDCGGTRLRPESLRFRVGGLRLPDFYALPAREALRAAEEWRRAVPDAVAALVVDEIRARLRYLVDVGLGYLTLDRPSRTLSGGEVERVHLTAALGSTLVNTLYVLDEPSVGLHPRDVDRLLGILHGLKARGNTVVVVEHDPDVIRAADHVVDLGPGPGPAGGRVVYAGPPAGLPTAATPTGRVLARKGRLNFLPPPTPPPQGVLRVRGAQARNLKGVDVTFLRGRINVVTGVSGSGKSTLVEEVLYRGILRLREEASPPPGACEAIEGHELFREVHWIGQEPLARTPRATLLTYLKAFDAVRQAFAATPDARRRRLEAGAFSLNVPGGRCERCKGAGVERVEMQFLPDVEIPCPECGGSRYRPEVLAVRLRGKNLLEVLDLTAAEALAFFEPEPAVVRALTPLVEVGLGYLRLGQPLSALSAGEAQRLRIARFLAGNHRGRTLFLLDEPTTGLHGADVEALLRALFRLRDEGHTLILIEHHLGVIAAADHVVDLGPEGGDKGGEVVAAGPPARVAATPASQTGRYLRAYLDGQPPPRRPWSPPAELPPPGIMRLEGVREHNLKNLSVDLPHGRFIVVTGPSGSGKSTLAFDVLFAEGQRAYIESLSTYARRYVPALPRPEADRVTGLPPAVAIEQRISRAGGHSTVATVTEIYHYLRLLFARAGVPHCPRCGEPMGRADEAEAARRLVAAHGGRTVRLLAPLVRRRRGYHREAMERARKLGYREVRVDGRLLSLEPVPRLDRYREHDVEVVVARLALPRRPTQRLRELLAEAFRLGRGQVRVAGPDGEALLSRELACPRCGTTGEDPDPRLFSFHHPLGACPRCSGTGVHTAVLAETLVPDPGATLKRAFPVLSTAAFTREERKDFLRRAAEAAGISLYTRWRDLPPATRRVLLHGRSGVFEGLVPWLQWVREARPGVDAYLEAFLGERPCPACRGTRLRPEALAVKLGEHTIADLTALPVERARKVLAGLRLPPRARALAAPLLREALARLRFLERVGLGYLTLDRPARTLSGGEAQRVRLAAQLGAELTGVLYVLDEPTIGLHPADNERLLQVLRELRDRGNTVVVVEHDPATILAADHIVDLGPGGGVHGGQIMAQGPVAAVRRARASATGRYLRRRRRPVLADTDRTRTGPVLTLQGARGRNLRAVDLTLPLGALTVVTGVSGSGKSTLIRETLLPAVRRRLGLEAPPPLPYEQLSGWEGLRRAVEVDQSPIGRTPASVPATYVGIMDEIRRLFALTPEARARGYTASRFSFNRPGGACPACKGQGRIREEMAFLPDVTVPCEVCGGQRYTRETLACRFKGKSIADVLAMTVAEAAAFFADHPRIHPYLDAMERLGLGYLTLGQPSPTLSGGEAQRLKLVEELGNRRTGPALLVLDEPTTGLHPEDVERLLAFFRLLTGEGHTLVVIEHNLQVIAAADHIVDLGPGGGARGGRVVAAGPPARLAARPPRGSRTARYLAAYAGSAAEAVAAAPVS